MDITSSLLPPTFCTLRRLGHLPEGAMPREEGISPPIEGFHHENVRGREGCEGTRRGRRESSPRCDPYAMRKRRHLRVCLKYKRLSASPNAAGEWKTIEMEFS
jgi:hypothetical protein